MKNTLEQDLVTNSGRESGGSLFLSLPHSFSRQSPLVAARAPAQAVVQPLPRASAAPATSAPAQQCKGRHCCPSLLSQELRPPTPAHKVRCPAPRAGGGCQLWPLGTPMSCKSPLCMQPSRRQDLRFLTYFISTEQLQLGRAGPPPAAEKILWNCFHSWTPEMPCNEL